jgi:hypothetical protein
MAHSYCPPILEAGGALGAIRAELWSLVCQQVDPIGLLRFGV